MRCERLNESSRKLALQLNMCPEAVRDARTPAFFETGPIRFRRLRGARDIDRGHYRANFFAEMSAVVASAHIANGRAYPILAKFLTIVPSSFHFLKSRPVKRLFLFEDNESVPAKSTREYRP